MNARPGFIGKSGARREHARFLTGRGKCTDDTVLPGPSRGVVLRSPHAHATIKSIATTARRRPSSTPSPTRSA